jgi:hypothetical protein
MQAVLCDRQRIPYTRADIHSRVGTDLSQPRCALFDKIIQKSTNRLVGAPTVFQNATLPPIFSNFDGYQDW